MITPDFKSLAVSELIDDEIFFGNNPPMKFVIKLHKLFVYKVTFCAKVFHAITLFYFLPNTNGIIVLNKYRSRACFYKLHPP